eukprot:m.173628 g.173628  ORF g.173628 m.173628 type:complete len:102 (+) comp16533_c8_seq2:93-398(+)
MRASALHSTASRYREQLSCLSPLLLSSPSLLLYSFLPLPFPSLPSPPLPLSSSSLTARCRFPSSAVYIFTSSVSSVSISGLPHQSFISTALTSQQPEPVRT